MASWAVDLDEIIGLIIIILLIAQMVDFFCHEVVEEVEHSS